LNQEDVRQSLAELGKKNLFFLCSVVLYPPRASSRPPFVYNDDLHKELCAMLESSEHTKKLILVPRGHYKTTLVKAWAIQRVLNNPNERILFLSASDLNPKRTIQHIENTFERNQLFRWLYPEIIPNFNKTTWSKTEATVQRSQSFPEPTFDSAGFGTGLPGRHYSILIKDDIVNDKNSNTPELEDQVIEWDSSTIPLFDSPEDPGNVEIVIGTPWTHTDAYSVKRRDPDFAVYIRHALELNGKPDYDNGLPIFPERFTKQRIQKIRARLENDDLFFCQYMCDPHGGGSADFQRDFIQYYEVAPRHLAISVTIDPGGLRQHSDSAAFTVVGVDANNDWYVLSAYKRRMNPREQIEELFNICEQFPGIHTIGIETVAWQKALKFFAEEEMRKRGKFLPIKELRTDTRVSKPMRIRGLIPRFSNRTVFTKKHMTALEDELFCRVKADDLKDALAYQLQVATYRPMFKEQAIINPFSIESVLAELAHKKLGIPELFSRNLVDTLYVDPQEHWKQLEAK
jgi:hypothetical protein